MSDSVDDLDDLIGARLGHYAITAKLGQGGMGVVYRATDERLGRTVALKVLPPDFAADDARRGRFEREARSAAAVNHPNIATIYEVGESRGRAFLAMELVEGVSLRERIARGPVPLAEALGIARGIARGLARAHEKGIVHRDLKPDNVMVTDEGEPKILDFGLARNGGATTGFDATAAAMTMAGQVMGTPGYMSPEQAAGKPVDARTDVFALGVVLYELACGRRPFQGASALEMMIALSRDEPTAPSSLVPSLPRDLERLIAGCLAKRPEERYATAREVSRELDRIAAVSVESQAPALASQSSPAPHPAVMPAATQAPGQSVSGLALPDRPSIAVLPFQNMSGDPEQEYFADGIVEDIITALSRFRWLFVIARNSSFVFKGRAVDVRQVARELGVRYVLEGSVRKAGGKVRITGQLIEADSGAHVWAERYDGALADVFDLQDRITESVVGAIEPSVRRAEIERARRKHPDNLDAYDLLLRSLPHVISFSPADTDAALELLGRALALAPDYAAAHAYAAWCLEQRFLRGGHRAEDRAAALMHARRALAVAGDDAQALALGGFVVGMLDRGPQNALPAVDEAIALNANSAQAFGFSAILRVFAGDFAVGMEHAERSLRLSPLDPQRSNPLVALAYAHFFSARFAEAAATCMKASQANPRFPVAHVVLAAARARMGQLAEAHAAAARLLELEPGFTVAGYQRTLETLTARPDWSAELGAALHEAGLPP